MGHCSGGYRQIVHSQILQIYATCIILKWQKHLCYSFFYYLLTSPILTSYILTEEATNSGGLASLSTSTFISSELITVIYLPFKFSTAL